MDYCTSDMFLFFYTSLIQNTVCCYEYLTMYMILAEIFVHKYLNCLTVSVKFSSTKFNKICIPCSLQSYFIRCSACMLVCLRQTGNMNQQSKHFIIIIPTDTHNYKITGMLKTIKTPIIAPTCFGSCRNHHQGAFSC